jgi:hypothetical protein
MKTSTFWDVTVPRLMSTYANVVFAVLWIGFIIALVVNREWLTTLWNWVQDLPAVPRIFIWVVLTPIMTTLWIWESSWSTFGQVAGFAGIVAWTLVAVSGLVKAFR